MSSSVEFTYNNLEKMHITNTFIKNFFVYKYTTYNIAGEIYFEEKQRLIDIIITLINN